MIGSGAEAEDAVQETMVRAWRAADKLEARGALKAWLFKIANHVCLDMLQSAQRRAQPMDLGPAQDADSPLGPILDNAWVRPIADARVLPEEADPAELAAERETLRLAFVAALQHLPPKQRAVLILREVLRWQATEVAELLETSVASVNSALQRARATLADGDLTGSQPTQIGAEQQQLLANYLEAFERYDIDRLVALIHEDANFTMPPFPLWLKGTPDIAKWYVGQGHACEGSRLIPTFANGCAAFGAYKQSGPTTHDPFALQVIEVSGDRITGLHHFLDTSLFAAFGLPPRLEQ